MSLHWDSVVATGVAAFVYAAIVGPILVAYGRWKRDPTREIVYRQNIFGRFVPDLRRKRIERAIWLFIAVFFVLGALADWEIMTRGKAGSWYDPQHKIYYLKVPAPSNH